MSNGLKVHHRIWALSTLALITLLAINGIQSYRAINELVVNEERTGHTQAVLRAIKAVFSSVQDAELGLRGYLISGSADHLKPYFLSLEAIQQNLDHLESLDSELSVQKARVQELKELIKKRIGNLTDDINQKSVNTESEWIAASNMNESHESMLRLSQIISDMEQAEYNLLDRQSAESRRSRSKVMFTIVVANSALMLLIIIISILNRRSIDRQRAEAELLESKVEQRTEELQLFSNELKRSNRELQDFAFVASHDLQEPLRKIRAFGDRLQSRYADKLDDDGADYIARMQNAAERMSNLIGDLLEFSRVSTRSDPFKAVDLNDTLREILEDLEMVIDDKQAKITVNELPIIEADATQMKQLFQNLISNALKFVAEGKQPNIEITRVDLNSISGDDEPPIGLDEPDTLQTNANQAEIHIIDNGIGFEEKYLDRIFTPFQRLHGKHEFQGTGIGLSICRRIVERHQGHISASSSPGEGTTFKITLPIKQNTALDLSEEVDGL